MLAHHVTGLAGLGRELRYYTGGLRLNYTLLGEPNMPKKRKKTKKDNSSITRRDMLKGAGAAGAAAVLGPIMLTSRKAFAFQDPIPTAGDGGAGPVAEPVSCDFGVISPPTRPFVDTLPVPATAPRTTLFPRPTQNANIGGG